METHKNRELERISDKILIFFSPDTRLPARRLSSVRVDHASGPAALTAPPLPVSCNPFHATGAVTPFTSSPRASRLAGLGAAHAFRRRHPRDQAGCGLLEERWRFLARRPPSRMRPVATMSSSSSALGQVVGAGNATTTVTRTCRALVLPINGFPRNLDWRDHGMVWLALVKIHARPPRLHYLTSTGGHIKIQVHLRGCAAFIRRRGALANYSIALRRRRTWPRGHLQRWRIARSAVDAWQRRGRGGKQVARHGKESGGGMVNW